MRTFIKGLAVTLGLALPLAAQAELVSIATGSQGSLGYNTGQAVAKVLNMKAKIRARTQPLAGTAAYVPQINSGKVDFGFANSVESEFAYTGTGNFPGQSNENLRLVGVMFPLRTGLVVNNATGIETIEDLSQHKGELRIASEYPASKTITYYIEGALQNGGMSFSDFVQVPVSNLVKGMEALGEKKVDITLISLNSAAAKRVSTDLRSDGGFKYVSLDTSDEAVARFKKVMPSASIIPMPANENIPGLQKQANIIQIPWLLLVNKDVPEELVYKVTKAIAENNEDLSKSMGSFRLADVKNMAPKHVIPYHSGAIKYFQEAGIGINK